MSDNYEYLEEEEELMRSDLIVEVELTWSVQVTLFSYYRIIDSISDFSHTFESGKIYGLISGMGQGNWAISYLLSGKEPLNQLELNKSSIKLNGQLANQRMLQGISCYVGEGLTEEPYRNLRSYPNLLKRRIMGIKTVKEQIISGLERSKSHYSYSDIKEMFDLTEREDLAIQFQSGERWRASMAIGFSHNKKLFCCPWTETFGIGYLLGGVNKKYIELLRSHGKTIVIPLSHEKYLSGLADEIITLKDKTEMELQMWANSEIQE